MHDDEQHNEDNWSALPRALNCRQTHSSDTEQRRSVASASRFDFEWSPRVDSLTRCLDRTVALRQLSLAGVCMRSIAACGRRAPAGWSTGALQCSGNGSGRERTIRWLLSRHAPPSSVRRCAPARHDNASERRTIPAHPKNFAAHSTPSPLDWTSSERRPAKNKKSEPLNYSVACQPTSTMRAAACRWG